MKKKVCESVISVFKGHSMYCMSEGMELGKEFMLASWHVVSNTTREELEEMIAKDTYAVHPILAYDIFRKIVKPKDYRKTLTGETVEVCFCLTHYTILKCRDDRRPIRDDTVATFVADIE